ncbi:MAG: MarR family transcriptional regulator [Flavobacteriales bacterium]|jgi:MarR family transcriptional regulator, organic hydroperoxide resistance regulator|nr:MarR family transcriptional regulator [Flavobacteriales bacterium]MBT4478651.1 MarR family transcriptional regulator [Flavobacteriales bacterium]MBT4738424.1 MarR family transcriptional regulator [Flavobacteriales bacterium]MBT5353888.1 MarR family transcriptional regulator [Flavobacteriales bacterium]MBT6699879.1 MarR family transcriptional regulator [Flavobacteriales bacterium]|tara:strand:+ start:71 stop:499 length:429 start_codon:yes stop_codon:yes gene_type:complete
MEPEDTIDYNIRKTWYNITKLYNRTANEYMASMALGMIILNIDIMEGTPSTQLGPNMGMEATSLSRSLNKLEESAVIERRPHPKDKRKTVIHLTPLGMEWREVAKEVVVEFNETIFSYFEKEEMDTFFAILKKINKIIDEKK